MRKVWKRGRRSRRGGREEEEEDKKSGGKGERKKQKRGEIMARIKLEVSRFPQNCDWEPQIL